MSNAFASLAPWMHDYGVAIVFLILMLESIGLPLPGESLLITAAILAGRGDIGITALFFAAWAGAVVGDNIGYLIGRRLGHALLRHYGAKVGLTAERLDAVEAVFARYGLAAVGFARFFNVLRQLNGVVAGALAMEWRRFLLFNALGGALWVLTWTALGFYVGEHGADIAVFFHKLGLFGGLLGGVAAIAALIWIYARRSASARDDSK
ncbi:MAG: DedA family protein [Proteobacteria bacterium]|nr:DedA family protein [Pseudomonadota bacterium]